MNYREMLEDLVGEPSVARELSVRYTTPSELARASAAELAEVRGVGDDGARRLVAALGLGRWAATETVDATRTSIGTPGDVDRVLRPRVNHLDEETFWVLLLDARCRLMGAPIMVAMGTIDRLVLTPADVLRPAVRAGCSTIAIAHNHPSGEPEPSPADLALTRRLVAACRNLGIRLLDHVVVAAEGYASIRERNAEAFDS